MNRRSFLKSSAFSLMGLAAVCLGCGSQQTASSPTAHLLQTKELNKL